MIISIDAGVIFYYDFQTLMSVQPLSHVEMEQVAKTPEEDTVVLVLKDSLAKIATRVRGFPNFSCDESVFLMLCQFVMSFIMNLTFLREENVLRGSV